MFLDQYMDPHTLIGWLEFATVWLIGGAIVFIPAMLLDWFRHRD